MKRRFTRDQRRELLRLGYEEDHLRTEEETARWAHADLAEWFHHLVSVAPRIARRSDVAGSGNQ